MEEVRDQYRPLKQSLEAIAAELGEAPKAVLCISGHWDTSRFTLMTHPQPPMLYDYYGFPPHTYEVRYPAPGAPDVARRVRALIEAAGLPTGEDDQRGFDHGTFVPLAVMYPQANVPVLQLSLQQSMDPALHLALGRALRPLRDEGILILGSGLSFHNLRLRGPQARVPSAAFDAWLHETLERQPPGARSARLLEWESAPAARLAHPHEDHLLPLMVTLGAAEDEAAVCVYHEPGSWIGWTMSSWRFGAVPQHVPAALA